MERGEGGLVMGFEREIDRGGEGGGGKGRTRYEERGAPRYHRERGGAEEQTVDFGAARQEHAREGRLPGDEPTPLQQTPAE